MKCKNSNLYANGHSIFQLITNFWCSNYRVIRFVNKTAETKLNAIFQLFGLLEKQEQSPGSLQTHGSFPLVSSHREHVTTQRI